MVRKNLLPRRIAKRYWKSRAQNDMLFLTAGATCSQQQSSDITRPHFHSTYTVSALEDGALPLTLKGNTVTLHPGEIIIIGHNIPHLVDPSNLTDVCNYRTVTIDEASLSPIVISKIGDAQNTVAKICDQKLWEDFVRGQQDAECGDTKKLDVMKGLTESIFYEMSQNVIFRFSVSSPYVRSAIQYMEDNYMSAPSIDDLARIANLSPFYLMRIFKEEVGISLHAYMNQLRINRAQNLMRQGESLLGITYELGFADQSHFSKTFLKLTGVSPVSFNTTLTAN